MTRAEAEKLCSDMVLGIPFSNAKAKRATEKVLAALTAPPRIEISEAAQSDFDSDLPHWIGDKADRFEIMKAALRACGIAVVE